MRNDIELEEGEAYFSEDDDEKLDPDRDFSYIDWKVDNLLGQYRNDFAHGYSVECRGPRYGDYGSFLPMYERSLPLLPVLRSQSHSTSKSPPNHPSKLFSENRTVAMDTSPPVKTVPVPHVPTEKCTLERSPPLLPVLRSQGHSSLKSPPNLPSKHFSENRTVAANTSPPVKTVPVPHVQTEKCALELGICNVNNQSKVKHSAECASNQQQQPKKPIIHHSAQNSLKFKVKMASESVLSLDNAAIYSGLGLDMSPASSPEGTPLEFDRSLPDFQQFKLDSPSFIIEIMTSMPFPNDALISPLHDDLMSLMKMEQSVETSLPGLGQAESLNIMYDDAYIQGKKEAGDERKPNLNHTRNEKNSKQNEATQVRKPRKYLNNEKPAEFVKEDGEFLANLSDFGAIRREEIGTLVGKKMISNTSINAVDAHTKEAGKFSDSRPAVVFDNKSEVRRVAEEKNNYMKHGQMGGHKVKDEYALVSSDATAVEEGNWSKVRTNSTNGDSKITIPKAEPGTNKKNEFGHRKDEVNNFSKQYVIMDIIKEDSDSGCPKEADDYRKRRVTQQKIAKDKEVCLLSGKDIKANNKHVDIHQELKHHGSEYFESSKQKSNIKATPHLQMGPSLEEPSSSLVKKKLNDPQTGFTSSADPLTAGIVRSSDPKGEDIIAKSKIGDVDLPKGMRKGSDFAVIESPNKKGKEVSSRVIAMGLSVRDAQPPANKMKELLSSKNSGVVNTGANLEGEVTGGNWSRGRVPVGDLLPLANGSLGSLEMEDWVQCEKCDKWRLLPFGTNPNSLSKKWICSMLNWLPGMNKCSVSEDETTRALRSLYVPSAPVPALPVQNYQSAHFDGIASAKTASGAQNVGLSNLVLSSDALLSNGKNKNLTKLQVDAVLQSGAQDLHRPINNDPLYFGEIRNPKNLKKLPLETACAAAERPSRIPTKRTAETEVPGVPKKMKNVQQQSMEMPIVIGPMPPEAKGGNQNFRLDAFRNSRDVMPMSSKCVPPTVINRGQSMMSVMDNDVFEKKRKLTDQQQSVVGSASFSNSQRALNNLVTGKHGGTEPRKETNTSNIEARDSSADQGDNRTLGDGHKHNVDGVSDGQRKVSTVGRNTLDPYYGHQLSQKTADSRKYSENNLDLGLSDNATTSSSSKISIKVQAEASKLKSSPAGSISSSPLKVCMSGPDKGTNKVVSSNEPEESSSRKRLKSSVEGAYASQGLASRNGEINGRKSNLSKISGLMSNAAQEDHFSKKVSSGRQTSAHSIDSQHKLEDINCHGGKFNGRHHERGTVALQRNTENQIANGLHFNGTSSERQKLLAPDMSSIKELSNYNHASDFERASGSYAVIAANGYGNLSRPVLVDHVSLRHPHQSLHISKDIEAKTALKEANDLKHSASRLKSSGSRFSTGIFFQAALKFLHGASLLEPGTIENGRNGEVMSTEVYSSSAKLCEYCAHEYEKCKDMASAALAYKCMEVAYMRLVYNGNAAATRDRLEVQMALRVIPQVESPSSSASDIDNLNYQVAIDSVRGGHALMDHRSHVISARNRPNFTQLLSFTHNINLAMVASSKSQSAFGVANHVLLQERNERGISYIKRVLDFSFHDVEGLLHLVRLAMEALNN